MSTGARQAEREIDRAYWDNALLARPYTRALWYLLTSYEEFQFLPLYMGPEHTRREWDALHDNLKFYLKTALHWISSSCPKGGSIPDSINWVDYDDARRLVDLAQSYDRFATVFTYASHGMIALDASGKQLVMLGVEDFAEQSQFEAYDRLIGRHDHVQEQRAFAQEALRRLESSVGSQIVTRNGRFSIPMTPAVLTPAEDFYKHTINQAFTLPPEWKFSRFSLGEFREAFTVISAICLIHLVGRHAAAALGIPGAGVLDSLVVLDASVLASLISRRTSIGAKKIASILETLTYGAYPHLKLPDPALQPLIPTGSLIFIPPTLVTTSNPERNLIALMNRIPEEQAIYDKLKDHKERIMRDRMVAALRGLGYRNWSGKLPFSKSTPDVDLAVIDDRIRTCLVMELKSFLEPAEAREVIQRSRELQKGISQALFLQAVLADQSSAAANAMGISGYRTQVVVVSANSIGMYANQHEDIPVINERHLVHQIRVAHNLDKTCSWLAERAYLPVNGLHYRFLPRSSSVARWTVEWYVIEPLVGEFLPV